MINSLNDFNPFFLIKNAHIQTIVPVLFDFLTVKYKRIKIDTPDNDFLDVDTLISTKQSAIILIHGLEGSSSSHYIKRMALKTKNTHDVFVLNLRGCSGKDNNNLYAYHSGKTEDLNHLVTYVLTNYTYKSLVLIGYSLGANLALKYVGQQGFLIDSKIQMCMAISAPIDLSCSADRIDNQENAFYKNRFLKSLLKKVAFKRKKFPDKFDFDNAHSINSIRMFDDWFTAKVNGFANAEDYYQKNASQQFLENISIPTYLISSQDDPFLSAQILLKPNNKNITCIYPEFGGHVGFWYFSWGIKFWMDEKILSILKRT